MRPAGISISSWFLASDPTSLHCHTASHSHPSKRKAIDTWMDPLSITLACVTLVGVVSKVSTSLTTLSRDFRDAPSEIKATALELSSVRAVLVNLTEQISRPGGTALSSDLAQDMGSIIKNCSVVVSDIEECLSKHLKPRRGVSDYWLLGGGKDELARYQSRLEAHKSALQIALQILAVNSLQNISRDTAQIPQIKDDMKRILKELKQLRARVPADEAVHGVSKALSETLDDMARQVGHVPAHCSKSTKNEETDDDSWDSDTACLNGPAPLSPVLAKSMVQAKVPKSQSPRRKPQDPDHAKLNPVVVSSPQLPSPLLPGSTQPKGYNNQQRLRYQEILQRLTREDMLKFLIKEEIPRESLLYIAPPNSLRPKSLRFTYILLRQTTCTIPDPCPDPHRPFEFPDIMRYVVSQPWTLYLGRNSQRECGPDFIDIQTPGVSELHCKIWLENGQWFVADVQKTSCTWLNGTWLLKIRMKPIH